MAKRTNQLIWGAAIVALYSLAVQVSARTSPGELGAQLLETGEFHGDEVKARTGERWLGLYVSKQKSALVPSTLRVTRVHDPIVDEHPHERTGKRVSVNRRPDPILLVRGTDRLVPGHITSVFVRPMPLKIGSTIPLKLGRKVHQLQVVTKGPRGDELSQAGDDVTLVLANGKTRQIIYRLKSEQNRLEAGEWKLLWAGDLDGDAKLDLYVEVSRHYNVSQRKLFLSSPARSGHLVREIAAFETNGC